MDAQTLKRAMGNRNDVDYGAFVAGVNEAMLLADITTFRRAAHFLSQIGHESSGLYWMREIDPGYYLNGRLDLGNDQPGDGPKYRGAGPIQLTGKSNFRRFGVWCAAQGLVPDGEYFVRQPELVATPRWGLLAAAWYWKVARPQLNAYAEADDLEAVTRAINGGTNGINDRQARLITCKSLGDAILPENIVRKPLVEKRLDYDRNIVAQETPYWCGPASCQVVLNNRGIFKSEQELATALGTHTGGTDHIGLITTVLNRQLPEAKYATVQMPNDPPTAAQREALWTNLKNSIDAGYGAVTNIVAPVSNYPRGVHGSTSPIYAGGTVYHYFTVMGYYEDNGERGLWIADSGFRPYGYWISLEQLATLIPPKGYSYSTVKPVVEPVKNAIDECAKVETWIGAAVDKAEFACPDGVGRGRRYENGMIYWTPQTGAKAIPNALVAEYAKRKYEAGPSLGYPTQSHSVSGDGWVQAFQRGVLMKRDSKSAGYVVHGKIGEKFAKIEWEKGFLGWPTSDEVAIKDGVAQTFENGTLFFSADGVPCILNPRE